VEGEFDRDIVIRRNAPEVLAAEIPKLRERGTFFVGSGSATAINPPKPRRGSWRPAAASWPNAAGR